MKYEITKEQILEAHKSACGDWKKKIESWFPDVFKNTLEVGKWYKNTKGNNLYFIEEILNTNDTNRVKSYGFNHSGIWSESTKRAFETLSENYIPATDTEVEEMLIMESKKRGFIDGVSYYGVKGMDAERLIKVGKIGYNQHGIYCANSYVFFKGKWATIVEQPTEMTHDEIEKALGKKIRIVNK